MPNAPEDKICAEIANRHLAPDGKTRFNRAP